MISLLLIQYTIFIYAAYVFMYSYRTNHIFLIITEMSGRWYKFKAMNTDGIFSCSVPVPSVK